MKYLSWVMLINKKVSVDQCLCARVKHRSSFCLLWVRIQLETENFNFSKQKNGYIFVFCQSPTINIYFIFLRIAWRLLLYRWHWGAMRSSFLHILDSLLIKYDMTRPHIEYFHLAFFEYLGVCPSQKNRCQTQAIFFVNWPLSGHRVSGTIWAIRIYLPLQFLKSLDWKGNFSNWSTKPADFVQYADFSIESQPLKKICHF